MLGADRLAYWAPAVRLRQAHRASTCPGEAAGIVPVEPVEDRRARPADVRAARSTRPGIGQGYDVVTPIQLINAYAALANGGKLYRPQLVREVVGPDGTVIKPFKPDLIRKLQGVAGDAAHDAARGPLDGHPPPHLQPRGYAREGGRQVRHRRVRHPRREGPPAVPLLVRRLRAQEPATRRTSPKTDSQLVFLAFAYDSRTKGNAGTEIAKAFLQLHFHIKKDYLNHDLLETRQLLPEQLSAEPTPMRVMRAEPSRFTDVTDEVRRGGLARLRPAAHGLRGAARRDRPRDGLHEQRRGGRVRPAAAAPCSPRALMWSGLAIVVFIVRDGCSTTAGSRRSRWPIWFANLGLLVLTLAIGDRRRRLVALGQPRPAHVPVLRARRRS